jgi:RimJ/RimL family protein N-acetyltransferase
VHQIDKGLVVLRPLREADVPDILSWVNDPWLVGNLAAFSGAALTRDDELAYVRKMMSSSEDRVFTIVDAADGAYAGQVGIHQIHRRSRVGRLGCIVAPLAKRGRGIGIAAIARALDVAFGPEQLHKCWAIAFATNDRMRRLLLRLGFVVEGTLREEYFHRERWHDMVRFSLLAREWDMTTTS